MTESFGKLNGKDIFCVTLENGFLKAEILNYGATLKSLWTKDKDGNFTDVCLGYDNIEGYVSNGGYFGATVGRFANRISHAKFELNKHIYRLGDNEKGNTLHGGKNGFDKKIWDFSEGENFAVFKTVSPDGEEGFPGNAQISVTYTLRESALEISYRAVSDRDTPMSLTNHSYFNLGGHNSGKVLSHILTVNADSITPVDENLIPTGKFTDVTGTVFDLRKGVTLKDTLYSEELSATNGYDHNFALNRQSTVAATLFCPETKIKMDTFTTLEGLQLYIGTIPQRIGKGGAVYGDHNAVCLETQHFPDSINIPTFPSPVLHAREIYEHKTSYVFSIAEK